MRHYSNHQRSQDRTELAPAAPYVLYAGAGEGSNLNGSHDTQSNIGARRAGGTNNTADGT
jgi:hypothetical protein